MKKRKSHKKRIRAERRPLLAKLTDKQQHELTEVRRYLRQFDRFSHEDGWVDYDMKINLSRTANYLACHATWLWRAFEDEEEAVNV